MYISMFTHGHWKLALVGVKGQNIGIVSLAIGACEGSKVIPSERALLTRDATFRATVLYLFQHADQLEAKVSEINNQNVPLETCNSPCSHIDSLASSQLFCYTSSNLSKLQVMGTVCLMHYQ